MAEREGLPAGHLLFLLAALLLGFWSRIWSVPLFDLDEGAFSEATVEMIHSGNYLSTTLNGEPRYDKPILIYWLQAASVRMLGVSELAFRLPSSACASLWAMAVYGFTWRQTRDRRAALFAAGSLALSLMPGLIGHAAIADALLNLLIALSLLDIYRYSESPGLGRLLRVYLWMALGFLAKGPIAVALPLVVSLIHFTWQRRPKQWLLAVLNPLGWLVFLAVVGAWVVPLYRQDHGEFLRHFLFEHNLGRYQAPLQGHGGGPWFYFVWLPVLVLPFTALLPGVYARARSSDLLDRFLLIWFATVFVFFSFSATQLPHYLLYGCTPLFILFGRGWAQAPRRGLSMLPALLLGLLLAALPWLLPHIHVPESRVYESSILQLADASIGWVYYLLSAACLGALTLLTFRKDIQPWQGLLGGALALSVLVWFGVVPVVAAAQQEPVREAALRARDLGLPVVSYNTWLPSFSVYRGEPTPTRSPAPGELVFLRRDRLPDLQKELGDKEPLELEFQRGGIALLKRPGGRPEGRTAGSTATPPAN